MKTTIGGDRLGSGNKQEVSLKTYNRSTHDLSYTWRSSMASGVLVPFLKRLALPGDSFDIDLSCEVLTLPTVGPLFGSFKVQLDIFQVPIRLYNAKLHMNKLGIGMEMEKVLFPVFKLSADKDGLTPYEQAEDNRQVNPSSLIKYLGVSGIGINDQANTTYSRWFNAVALLGFWDIFKNYYANKQEENAWLIHTSDSTARNTVRGASVDAAGNGTFENVYNTNVPVDETALTVLLIQFDPGSEQTNTNTITVQRGAGAESVNSMFATKDYDEETGVLTCSGLNIVNPGTTQWNVLPQTAKIIATAEIKPKLQSFPLENIDTMRLNILQHTPIDNRFEIDENSIAPYGFYHQKVTGIQPQDRYSVTYPMESLPLKTYQSDLFNNWISTDWIDGPNGVNEVTKVDTTGNSFTIDALNLAQKVYVMLNRIAISGGTYDDWLDAVYTHERTKSVENPMYMGSLIKELAFQEVVSTADTKVSDDRQPMGTLAGRGRLTAKDKGGRIKFAIHEPSYAIGIVSLTPRIDYHQGNDFDMSLTNMNDLHKPALDAIGYQDLVTDQMAWQDTKVADNGNLTYRSAGKQPAWINYMTEIDRVYGNFADVNKEMFMVLARRYEVGPNGIEDLTTYVDPTKFNFIFAQTELSAQNFWVQIGVKFTARRKMSAKVIPNL